MVGCGVVWTIYLSSLMANTRPHPDIGPGWVEEDDAEGTCKFRRDAFGVSVAVSRTVWRSLGMTVGDSVWSQRD